jgi:phage portal protein BeeE
MANTLGRVLSYVRDGWRYAFSQEKAARRSIFAPTLDQMARIGQYGLTEVMDTDAAMKLAVTSAWVWSDIKLIADRIASADARPEVHRHKKGAQEPVKEADHPFTLLQARPNSLMSGDFLTRYTAWWLLLRGNAFVFIATPTPGRGEPQELWPLPANAVLPMPQTLRNSSLTGGQTIDYEYTVNGAPTVLPGEHVIHFRFANPFDYWQGLSPLSSTTGKVSRRSPPAT